MDKVTFRSGGIECAAFLGVPAGAGLDDRRAGIVLGHGFGIRKESLVVEAQHLCDAGYVVLAIDYRTFGESGGEPRGQLFPLNEVEDFRNAISYLQEHEAVDAERIGIWGASFGGAVVIHTAAVDRRVRAVVAVAPVVSGRGWLRWLWGGDRYEQLVTLLEEDRRRRYLGEPSARVPTSAPVLPAALPARDANASFAHPVEKWGRQPLEGTPELTFESVEKVLEFEPDFIIDRISPRALCIVTPGEWDVFHPFDQIRAAYARAGEPKRIVPLPCEQMDVYLPPWQGRALEHAAAWYDEHLAPH